MSVGNGSTGPIEGDDIFAWLASVYVQRADDRQRAMGLQYTEAETHDLADGIARYVNRLLRTRYADKVDLRS